MGLYTDVIKERERKDQEMVRNADARMLKRGMDRSADEQSDGAQSALRYILQKYGLAAGEAHGYRDTIEMLDLMLDPLNVIYEEVELTEEKKWKKGTANMLGFLEDGKAVALMPSVVGYRYVCPSTGKHGPVTGKIRLQDKAYAIQRPIELESVDLVSMATYVMHLITPRDALLIGGATLLVSMLGLVAPKMNQVVLDQIVPMGTEGYSLLTEALILFLSVGVVRGAIAVAKTVGLARMRVRIPSQVQAAVMSRVLLLPQRFFMGTSTGKLSKQLYNSRLLAEQVIVFMLGATLTAVFSLVYVPQLASFSMVLLGPALTILIIKSAYVIVAGRFYAENERRRQDAEMENRAFLYTTFKGIQRIKESGAGKRVYAKWTEKYRAVLACDMDQPMILKLEDVVTGFLTALTTVVLLSLVVPQGIPKADYIAFNAAYAIIAAAIDDLLDAQRKIYLMKPMMAQLGAVLKAPLEDGREQTVMRKLRGDIRVENISFTYEDSNFGCLKDISLHIRTGEKVAIVGESGCGKSTLMKVILGVLKPESGSVFIDKMPLDNIHLRSYRRHIGAVFQSSKVMPGTIYSNIAFSPHPVSREEAEEAAVKADIHETIMELPLGYDTEISDSNTGGFSGGQRQRLLLARAFAAKPGLMILDEATSALDNISQSRVLKSVYQEKCTVIMVAHRLSTVRNCDKIVVLKDGTIAEEGPYDELMERKGEFYELMRRQEPDAERN